MTANPPKFALVPVEMTPEMTKAAIKAYVKMTFTQGNIWPEVWKDILAAAPKPDCVWVDTQAILDDFVEANDSDGYPFKGEEYDLKLIKFFLDWCNAQGLLAVKEKAKLCGACEGKGWINCLPDDDSLEPHTHPCDTCRLEDMKIFNRGVSYGAYLTSDAAYQEKVKIRKVSGRKLRNVLKNLEKDIKSILQEKI